LEIKTTRQNSHGLKNEEWTLISSFAAPYKVISS